MKILIFILSITSAAFVSFTVLTRLAVSEQIGLIK